MSQNRRQGEYTCTHCKTVFVRDIAQANACLRKNRNLYCSRACHTALRRAGRTDAEIALKKLQYGRDYTAKNIGKIRARDRERYHKTTTLEKREARYKKARQKILTRNALPENKREKKIYDCARRAKESYGEFWESQVLVLQIDVELAQTQEI